MLLSVQTSDPTTSKSQTTSSAISECPETQTVLSQGQAWAHRIEIRVLCASGTSGERWKNIHSISGGNLPEPKVDVGVVLSDLDVQENLKALVHSSFEENPGSSLLVKVAPKKDAFCQVTPRVGGFRGGTAQLQQKWTLCSTHCQCFSFPDDLQIEHL
jgi:hypothetical protein